LKNNKVVTIGEIMMRLSTPGYSRFTQATQMNLVYGGSEANVAISLSNFGLPTAHITRLPENDLGMAVVQHLKSFGVATDWVQTGSGRLGLYFLENGTMNRAPRLIYDRFHSAFSEIEPGSVDWNAVFQGASWFHWTGITPAISESAAQVCLEGIEAASKLGLTISGDINYRRNLWQYGKSVEEVMPPLIAKTHMIIGGATDFKNSLNIVGNDYEDACIKVQKAYPTVRKLGFTYRDSISASHNKVQAILWTGEKLIKSKVHDLTNIVDRIGAGDAFMAGLIYGWCHKLSDQETIEFAAAACAFKHSIEGDVNLATVEEVNTLVEGENVGKLLR
jgi:2-dehydro-3-deoxygluconokinase